MDSTYDRMKQVIKALGFTSCETFEDEVGLGHGFVTRITRNVRKASLDKIKVKFPQVNVGWIKSGRGEMFCEVKQYEEVNTLMERLEQFCKTKRISKLDFTQACGLYNGFFTKKSTSFQSVTLEKIHLAFPELNLEWLLNNKGEMISPKDEIKSFEAFSSYKDRLKLFIRKLGITEHFFIRRCGISRVRIAFLPDYPNESEMEAICKVYPQLNMNWVRTGEGNMIRSDVIAVDGSNVTTIPLVPQVAYAGYLSGFADEEYMETLPTIPFIREGSDKYVAFEVNGNSMDDGSSRAYQNGDIVICKDIPFYIVRDNGLPTNKEYIIVHREGILLKNIKAINRANNTLELHSFNPIYSDMAISLEDVRQILVVEFQQKRRRK